MPHKQYSESVSETIVNGVTTDKITVTADTNDSWGEKLFSFDSVLNLIFGDHFGIYLHPNTYGKAVYTVPWTIIETKDKDGNVVNSDYIFSEYAEEQSENSFYGLSLNFNINDVFVKTLGGISSYQNLYSYTSENTDVKKLNPCYIGGRFDLGFEIPEENKNHEVDLSFVFYPEEDSSDRSDHKDASSLAYRYSGKNLKGEYIFNYNLENSGKFAFSFGLDYYSNSFAVINKKFNLSFSIDEFTSITEQSKLSYLMPQISVALRYPLVQEKLSGVFGASANVLGFYKNIQTTTEEYLNYDHPDVLYKTTNTAVTMDKLPMSTKFYGGIVTDITDEFTLKSTIDLGVKDVTNGKLDYSFTVQGTYKL
ncbi:MAG: hypothetical protein MJ185_03915 [Treponema sp.]|nr:hypothetical protein [Treponema sp.]